MDTSSKRLKQLVLGFYALASLGIFVIWIINLLNGAWEQGIFAYQLTGSIPVFHLAAEFLMALVTLAGITGLAANRRWGRSVFLLGVGMFTYSAINAFGWALHNDLAQGIPMILSVLFVIPALVYALNEKPSTDPSPELDS